jgi:hypothetical protein
VRVTVEEHRGNAAGGKRVDGGGGPEVEIQRDETLIGCLQARCR